jgi:hypothetical protein
MSIKQVIDDIKELEYLPGIMLEKSVKAILDKYDVAYHYQPNGTQAYPDFYLTEYGLDLECKSSKNDKPMWNCTYPKKNTMYVISCSGMDKCIVILGKYMITDEIVSIYEEYTKRHRELAEELNKKLSKIEDNNFGMRIYRK